MMRPGEDDSSRYIGLPLRIDGIRPATGGHAPRLDEHKQQVFDFMKA